MRPNSVVAASDVVGLLFLCGRMQMSSGSIYAGVCSEYYVLKLKSRVHDFIYQCCYNIEL
jgi:hypothetical protein